MRLRNDPEAYQRLELCKNYVKEPTVYKGKWHEFFGNHHPIHMEIGSGKGQFITTLARQNPQVNYIALEKFPTVLLKLIRKIPDEGLNNLAVISIDAELLQEIFIFGEIDRLYLNFSDPWPKKRHAKRRLTSPSFLELYKKVLKKESFIEFKTDNRGLFDYSLEQFKECGYTITHRTFNLYESELKEGNVATEYEEKFHKIGTPINKLIAQQNNSKGNKEEDEHDMQA